MYTYEKFYDHFVIKKDIWIDENSIYACNYHAVDTEICIGLTEKNVEEDVIKNAINITGVDSSKVKMEFLTQGLKISFPDKLPLGQNINLAMAPIKDKYGIDVTGFTEYNFNNLKYQIWMFAGSFNTFNASFSSK